MAQFVVRNLEDNVCEKLRGLARAEGRSMEDMVREILRGAVIKRTAPQARLGSRMAKRFTKHGLDHEIEELRGHPLDPPGLDR